VRNLVMLLTLIITGCAQDNREISMACRWILYGEQEESFVFNLDKNEVYWVNENKRLPLKEINEGRIVFEGVRSSLEVSDGKIQNNVPLIFIIDRVTGKLDIKGIAIPSGYRNACATVEKII